MTEIELKLELDGDAVDAILASELFQAVPTIKHQHDIYFDTHDHALRQSGFSLRVRRTDDSLSQTVKASQAGSADIYARGEWEFPLASEQPVINDATPLAQHLDIDAHDLVRQFQVQVVRQVWLITQEDADIEVALDRGRVSAADRHVELCELELELRDGKAEALFTLARRIAAFGLFRIGVVSKSERGFSLMEGLRSTHKAEPVVLDPAMTTAAAFQAIASACFRHFRLNETILIRRPEPEALHQARVAIRRLRSAMSIFKPILAGDTLEHLQDELKWLASILGEARDIDVLFASARDDDMRAKLATARETAYDAALTALASPRAADLALHFNHWLHCGTWLEARETAEQSTAPISAFAPRALDRMRKKLKKHGQTLGEIDDDGRHESRKTAKKYRYAAEFLGSVFPDKKSVRRHKRFLQAMEGLQDELGALNDMVSAPAVLERLGLHRHPKADNLTPQASKPDLIERAQAALDEVADTKRFWR